MDDARLRAIEQRANAGDYHCREHWGQFDPDDDVLFLLAIIASFRAANGGVLSLEEARMVSLDDLRADIIHSAARGQGPTFIAAKLDMLIAKATFVGVLPEAK